jgi:hypothetical protein
VTHGHILVNGARVSVPASFHLLTKWITTNQNNAWPGGYATDGTAGEQVFAAASGDSLGTDAPPAEAARPGRRLARLFHPIDR